MQVLDDAGFEAQHIIALSSRKSESMVKKYATKCPDSKKCEMCQTLQNQLLPTGQKIPKLKTTATVSSPLDPLPVNFDLTQWNNDDDKLFMQFVQQNQHLLTDDNIKENTPQEENPLDQQLVPVTKNTVELVKKPQEKTVQNAQQNLLQNMSNTCFNMPVLPKMFFPGSNVTINYNFSKWKGEETPENIDMNPNCFQEILWKCTVQNAQNCHQSNHSDLTSH